MPRTAEASLYFVRFVTPGDGLFTYHGTPYDQGQLITLLGGPRDEQLIRLGYVAVTEKAEHHLHAQCGVCGGTFVSEALRDRHGRRRHRDRFDEQGFDVAAGMNSHMGAAAVHDTTGDAEERRLMAEAPLYLEHSAANRK